MRHENDLVHQRTTWLVTLQAGLVVVLSYLTQKYFDFFIAVVKKSPTDFLTLSDLHLSSTAFLVFWAIVCIVGIVSSIFAWISIKAAVRAQYQVNERWKCKFQTRAQWMGFPDLSGGAVIERLMMVGRLRHSCHFFLSLCGFYSFASTLFFGGACGRFSKQA